MPPTTLIEGEGRQDPTQGGKIQPSMGEGAGERGAKIRLGEPYTLPTELGRRRFTARKNPLLVAPPIWLLPLCLFTREACNTSESTITLGCFLTPQTITELKNIRKFVSISSIKSSIAETKTYNRSTITKHTSSNIITLAMNMKHST
jgi:hypothetical protein